LTSSAALVETAEGRPLPLALLWLAGLAPFFFLSYGFANWVTSLRDHVPELAFGWEHHIPFVAWTIVPYWSTDLFYAASLFVCRTRAELHAHGKRLIAVQVLCVAGFLLFPLRFGFERPHAVGLFGEMFDLLMSFDKPFNQAPSLHIALVTVLWVTYGRHFRGWVLGLIRVWFLLMALSTLTTYQHHFIDLPTGLWVGLFVMASFSDRRTWYPFEPSRDPRRFPISAAYLGAAAICVFAAYRIGGVAWILLWPAGAMAMVGGIYWAGRAEWFGKSEGVMSPAMIGLLAPYLAGAWLSSRWHTRRHARAHEIADAVWLGRIPRRADIKASGFVSVVDLTAEFPFPREGVFYRGIPLLDLLAPSLNQLEAAAQAIADLAAARPTLVCCALGYSRSAAAVAAWLIASGKASSSAQAIELIRARRPSIVLPRPHRAMLECWVGTRVNR